MFKRIFGLLIKIIFQPAKAWNILSQQKEDTNNDSFLKSYLYPLFGIIILLSFLGVFFNRKEFDVQDALKTTINLTVTVFLGFYLASFLLTELMARMFSRPKESRLCQRFVGYSSALVYALYMVLALFPEFFLFKISVFYSVYIVWEGATSYMNINENKKLNFTILASLIILASPYLIEAIMFMLMPGLRV